MLCPYKPYAGAPGGGGPSGRDEIEALRRRMATNYWEFFNVEGRNNLAAMDVTRRRGTNRWI
jgi:hypothetical protein